jgi:hypothetical protein
MPNISVSNNDNEQIESFTYNNTEFKVVKYLPTNFVLDPPKDIEECDEYEDNVFNHESFKADLDLAITSVCLDSIMTDEGFRCRTFTFTNPSSVGLYSMLYVVFHLLKANPAFTNFGLKFVILIFSEHIDSNGNRVTITLHRNVGIDKNVTFKTYIENVKDSIRSLYEAGYPMGPPFKLTVRCWNMDNHANKVIRVDAKNYLSGYNEKDRTDFGPSKTHSLLQKSPTANRKIGVRTMSTVANSNKRFITQLKDYPTKVTKPKSFGTVDIETISINGFHIPIIITAAYNDKQVLFIIDKDLFKKDREKAVENLMYEYFHFAFRRKGNVIFAHNLGGYDGLFIYKYLLKFCNYNQGNLKSNCIIDHSSKFITISFKIIFEDKKSLTYTFKDSYRIFPVSLNKLCKNYEVKGKISDYKMEYNNIDIFDNQLLLEELKGYALNDSIALYEAILKAQRIYLDDYHVDITSIVSTASLSLKIFRQHYLKTDIEILNKNTDAFVRKAYYGGATDIYKEYGENLYYYDVNSLYPFVMKFIMPTKHLKTHRDLKGVNIDNFFGFIKAKITVPKNIKHPCIPYRYRDGTIYPHGTWTGIYFSEFLKANIKLGCIVEPISGEEFEGEYVFKDYIDHFYDKKAKSKAMKNIPGTFISKMHLNQLYGVFGRKNEQIETICVTGDSVKTVLCTNIVRSMVKLDHDNYLILVEKNFNSDIINFINSTLVIDNVKLSSFNTNVNSNVAISAAVTAYAQIEMMKYKNNPNFELYYTDTDSIFIDKPLPESMIGSELGLMKNE